MINRKVIDDDEWQMVMSSYLSILARVLLLNQTVFIQVLQELNVINPFETIIDVWLRKMPLIGQPEKRKLCSMFSRVLKESQQKQQMANEFNFHVNVVLSRLSAG